VVRETVPVPRKTPRPPGPDDWASERIRYEREKRGWSTAELARRITLTGVPMRQPQVWQVESGTPRRRLSVGEAAAFARVFDISLAELMTPPEEIAAGELIELGRAFQEWRRDEGILSARLVDIAKRVDELSDDAAYTAGVVEKSSDLSSSADAINRDLETLIENSKRVMRSVKQHGSVWSVIASMRDQVPEQATAPPQAQQPVVAAIVTSAQGVLVGQRRDGKPPWTFIAGEQDAVKDENPADTAIREVKEETGLRVQAGEVIGERVHPKTGRTMIYIAATPTHGTDVFVNDEEELAEVRWVSLAEADELLPGMYEPVREHLARELRDPGEF